MDLPILNQSNATLPPRHSSLRVQCKSTGGFFGSEFGPTGVSLSEVGHGLEVGYGGDGKEFQRCTARGKGWNRTAHIECKDPVLKGKGQCVLGSVEVVIPFEIGCWQLPLAVMRRVWVVFATGPGPLL
jgi:hypothetical protein